MIIHIVQPGENIDSIAQTYGVSALRLIQENGIMNPYSLVPGQTIVITFPEVTHTVAEGDTLGSIEEEYGISHMQMLRNNTFLMDREYIYPGETLIIRYATYRSITTNGFTYPYINRPTLERTLPFLTFLSIFNYQIDISGVTSYEDDAPVIQLAKDYGTIPLMMISTMSTRGEPNLDVAFELLVNEEAQDLAVESLLNILREKAYGGINFIINYLTASTQELYRSLINRISYLLRNEGFLFYATINPVSDDIADIQGIDLSYMQDLVDGVMFMRFVWGINANMPGPVSSNVFTTEFVQYLLNYVSPDKLEVGIPVIGYEWELPYRETINAHSLTLDSALSLANDVNATIEFDEVSQTPFFQYYQYVYGYPTQYVVWFTDARSIEAVLQIVSQYGLSGVGIWNIMIYCAWLWLIINSQYDILKLIPDSFQDTEINP